jgi:hypothetical protein
MAAQAWTGYLGIERALGESDLWIAGNLRSLDHQAAVEGSSAL